MIEPKISALLLKSSVSHDPQKSFWFDDSPLKKQLLLSMIKTVVLLNIFPETDTFPKDPFLKM